MIKNTSMILVLNLFLFSGMANAETAGADAQEAAGAAKSAPVSNTKDAAQSEKDRLPLEKQDASNEANATAVTAGEKESTDLPANSSIDAAEREARKEMIAKQRAERKMAASVRAAKAEAARDMARRVRAARAEAAREMAARVEAAREEAAREMAARVKAAREDAAREMAARVKAAQEEAAREMAVRAKERAAREKEREARERYYRERMYRY